jgi:exodeoxyribonuclease-3
LQIVSWNVNSINARFERLRAFLQRAQPDVVCLQEIKCPDTKFPASDLKDLGYYAEYFGQKTYNGVAILSRQPIELISKGFGDQVDDQESRFIDAKIENLRVMSAYVPNGQEVGAEQFVYKLEWLKRLRSYLDKNVSADESVALVGDFNICRDERDVHDPDSAEGEIFFTLPERRALQNILDFGLSDSLRLHNESAGVFSWWDYRQLGFPMNRGLRIDYVFLSQGLVDRCSKAWVERDERKGQKPSDHAPVVVELSE